MPSTALGRRGVDLSGELNAAADPLGTLVVPPGDLVSFAVLVAGAVIWRRHGAVHKRLIVLATAGSLMAAPLAHLIAKLPWLRETPPIILIPLAAHVHGERRPRPCRPAARPSRFSLVWGGLALLAWAQLRAAVIGPSEAWHRLAGWLVR